MDFLSQMPNAGSIFRKPSLNWGVLGTAKIAKNSMIPAINSVKHNSVVAIASRDLRRAREFVMGTEIPKAYGSYEELLADENVQAVYIPLPNSEHAQWAIRAMQAKKHVLVEKPFALNAAEAQEMVDTSRESGVLLMEAFMYRYDPRITRVLEMVHEGEIGKPRFIHSSFSFNLSNPDDIRLTKELGGGAMYDIGCYCLNLQRLLVAREPLQVQASSYIGQSGVDLQMSAMIDFGDQVFTHFDVAINMVSQQYTRVVGTDGVLELDKPFNPDAESHTAFLTKNGETKKLSFKAGNNYARLVDHFYNVAISKDLPAFPLADSVSNAKVIDAIFQSANAGGQPVKLVTE